MLTFEIKKGRNTLNLSCTEGESGRNGSCLEGQWSRGSLGAVTLVQWRRQAKILASSGEPLTQEAIYHNKLAWYSSHTEPIRFPISSYFITRDDRLPSMIQWSNWILIKRTWLITQYVKFSEQFTAFKYPVNMLPKVQDVLEAGGGGWGRAGSR